MFHDVVITGSSGFIGIHLSKALRRAGYNVKAIDRDSGDVSCKDFWNYLPPSKYLIHLAGQTSVVSSWANPVSYISESLTSVQHAISWCSECSAQLVFPSSYIYGHPQTFPIDEDHPIVPSNPYALSKHFAEQLIAFSSSHKQLKATVLRLFNVYGPGQSDSFLIPHIAKQIPSGVVHINDPSPKRDYVHIDDVCEAFKLSLSRRGKRFEVMNIGSGSSVSVSDVLGVFKQISTSKFEVVCNDLVRTNEVSDICADITKAQTILDWHPRVSLYNGLAQLLIG